ncbi:MAG: hypothetical protein ACI311_06995 [Bacilli bacterium]
MSYYNECVTLLDLYEQEKLSTGEILKRTIEIVKLKNYNPDFMHDLNDALLEYGYPFQYDIQVDRKEFNKEEYYALCVNTTKSMDKTISLVDYLRAVSDSRLTMASIHMLKVKYLIEIGIIENPTPYILEHPNSNLRDLLFSSFSENFASSQSLIEALTRLGYIYALQDYALFRIDLEYMLWLIECSEPNYGYLKVNTLKVCLNIAPKEFFERGEKIYYNESLSKVTKEYLRLIDKGIIKMLIEKWGEDGNPYDKTGYQVLYKLLKNRINEE